MRRKLLIISTLFVLLIIIIFTIGQILMIDFIPDREGDIIQTSSDAKELIYKSPYLSFLEGNIESCKWYFQVADRSGSIFFRMYDYCYNGEVVLKSEYFESITTEYKWTKYDYEQHRSLNENDNILGPMYDVSIIRDSLKSKLLYVCDDPMFSDNGRYFTYLDKENRTFYFYWFAR